MTKNTNTPVQFTIEPLENRDAPKGLGITVNGCSDGPSYMSDWGEYKQSDGSAAAPGFNMSFISEANGADAS